MAGDWLVVFRKELVDGSRDRRSMMTLVFSADDRAGAVRRALHGVRRAQEERRRASPLPVAGAEYAPVFVDWLKQQTGVTIVPAPADAEQAVRDRDEDVVLIIDKEFEKDMARAVPAPVKLVSDVTRDSARPKVDARAEPDRHLFAARPAACG